MQPIQAFRGLVAGVAGNVVTLSGAAFTAGSYNSVNLGTDAGTFSGDPDVYRECRLRTARRSWRLNSWQEGAPAIELVVAGRRIWANPLASCRSAAATRD